MHCLNNQVNILNETIPHGVYTQKADEVVYERPGRALGDFCKDEILVTGGIPAPGVRVHPDAPMGRIWLRNSVVTDNLEPDLKMLDLARKVYDQYKFGNDEI